MSRVRRFRRAAGFASKGLGYAWRTQPNLRIETGIGIMALALAAWLGTGMVAVVLSCTLVISLELLNTAVEAGIDLVSPREHELAAIAKDLSAGAVLVAAIGAAIVGLIALGPALLARLGGAS